MADLQKLHDAILNGNHKVAKEVTQAALAEGNDPQTLVNDVMIPAMNEVGKRYEAEEYFVPELLIAARAMKASLELIRPLLTEKGAEPVGTRGDRDRAGGPARHREEPGCGDARGSGVRRDRPRRRRLAREVRGGREGTPCDAGRALGAADHDHGLHEGASWTRSSATGIRGKVKVMIGGAPITQKYARGHRRGRIRFDNANAAVALAHQLLAVEPHDHASHPRIAPLARLRSSPTGRGGPSSSRCGLQAGEHPDFWNLTHPDRVREVAAGYVQAGSRVILTNTFRSNRHRA